MCLKTVLCYILCFNMYLYQCYVIVYVTSYFIANKFQNELQNVLFILYKKAKHLIRYLSMVFYYTPHKDKLNYLKN